MSRSVNVTSALHGHNMSLSFAGEGVERRWYVGEDEEIRDEEIIDPEDTLPFGNRVNHPVVSHLLAQAAYVDIVAEPNQAYMPYPHTTLIEATMYLGSSGRVGIAGGVISWDEMNQVFSARMLIRSDSVILNWQEVIDLLRANYPRERE